MTRLTFHYRDQYHFLLRSTITGKIVAGHANKSKVVRLRKSKFPDTVMETKHARHFYIMKNRVCVFGSMDEQKVLAKMEELSQDEKREQALIAANAWRQGY